MNKHESNLAALKTGQPSGKPDGITASPEPANDLKSGAPPTKMKTPPGGSSRKVRTAAGIEPPTPIQPTTDQFPALEPQEGVLTYYDPTAKVVAVAGDFNGWHPEASPLAATGFGEWNVRLTLRPGQYEYRFWVDGAWADDPLARHTTPNPYGGNNALLKVGLDDRIEFL
jgi:hypothetical protein